MKNHITILLIFLSSAYIRCAQHTVYAHGIVDGPSQINRFISVIKTPNSTPICFPDAINTKEWNFNGLITYLCNIYGKKVNRNAMYMGQGKDLEAISQAIQTIPASESIILYGCSRGAAALVTYLATQNPQNVVAVILDACPTSLPATLYPKLARYGINPSKAETIFSTLFPYYNPATALTPQQAIKSIKNKQLPILLIHSKQDQVVPYQHSTQLYQEFIQQGFTNVDITILPTGRHSYLLQDEAVASLYQTSVQNFYQKHNLLEQIKTISDQTANNDLSIETITTINQAYEASINNMFTIKQRLYSASLIIAALILSYAYYYDKR